jgi:large subunit ribosomal protein L25
MSIPTLKAVPRADFGKGPNRRLRDEGLVPAVVYMKGKEPVTIATSPKDVFNIIQGPLARNTVINIEIEGESKPRLTFIREYQVHPVKRTFEHIDFWEITPDTFLTLTVPFAGEGRSESERQGGKVNYTRDDLVIRCKPSDIPAKITFDMTSLAAGNHNLTISKIPMPNGVKAVFKHDFSLIQVSVPKVQAVAATDAKKGKDAKKGGKK